MTDAPDIIRLRYDPASNVFRPLCNMMNGPGIGPEIYVAEPEAQRQRTIRSHNHYFAMIRDYWLNLPEIFRNAPFARSPETLRYHALCRTGWCEAVDHVCESRDEAERWHRQLRRMGPYTIVVRRGVVLRQYWPVSQSFKDMGAEKFQRSKDDVLRFLAELVGGESCLDAL